MMIEVSAEMSALAHKTHTPIRESCINTALVKTIKFH